MKQLRVYVDTSVLGGCFDPEFAPWSNGLIADFRADRFKAVLSEVTAAEVLQAPSAVRSLHAEVLGRGAEFLIVTPEARQLHASYRVHGVLGKSFENDMLHVALATIANVDVVVSWNFRHLVRLDRIRLFNAVNLEAGYKAIAIHSPREVSTYDIDATDSGC